MPVPFDMAGAFPASNLGSFGADLFIPWNVGGWYVNPISRGARNGGNPLNTLYLHPFNSGPDGCTIDQLDTNVVTVGGAGAVTRAGIYFIANQARPLEFAIGQPYANLALDAGTQPTDGSTGEKVWTLTPSVVFQPNVWFAIAGVDQVVLATRSLGNNVVGTYSPYGGSGASSPYVTPPILSLVRASVLGSLPSVFVVGNVGTIDGGIGFHRSA